MRLLFTSVPLAGHFYPMVPLAWAARAAGHDVLVATTAGFTPSVLRSGLPAVTWGDNVDFVELASSGGPGETAEDRDRRHGKAFGLMAARCLPSAADLIRSWRPDVLINDRAEFAGPIAAEAAGVPHVEFHWGVAPLTTQREAALATLGQDGPPPPARVLNPWPPGMRLPHAAGHSSVRNVAYNGDAHLPGWLLADRRPGVPRICVTFGTLLPRMASGGLGAVAGLLDHLATLGAEVLVAADEKVLADYPEINARAARAGRMPLAQVLPTSDLMINHGGQGTVLTALGAACPQLIVPQIDDQFDNAAAVVAAGAGLSLTVDELTADKVIAASSALLGRPEFGRAAARVADDMAAQPALAEVVDALAALAH
jgi:UDP:flavonoid glycosyltransferase YjiC (YdhE family)